MTKFKQIISSLYIIIKIVKTYNIANLQNVYLHDIHNHQ